MGIYVLSRENHKLYNMISEAISAHQQKVSIPSVDSNHVLSMYNKVLSENPEGLLYKVGSIRMVISLFGASLILSRKEDRNLVNHFDNWLRKEIKS